MSVEEGRQLKAEGQAKAASSASDWHDRAMEVITELIEDGQEITSEDVTNRIGLPSGGTGMNDNNAVGSVFSNAARKGIIEWTGRLVQSSREERHASDLRVWRKPTPQNPFLSIQADTARRLAALAEKGLAHVNNPDIEFVIETEKMIKDTRAMLAATH